MSKQEELELHREQVLGLITTHSTDTQPLTLTRFFDMAARELHISQELALELLSELIDDGGIKLTSRFTLEQRVLEGV